MLVDRRETDPDTLIGDRQVSQGTPVLRFEIESASTQIPILFVGDLHWDHPSSDRKKIKHVFDKALKRNAWIVMLGDTFCAMQGRNDKRADKGAIRPEHQREDYFSALTETAADWFRPYKDNIWIILEGNHESSVKRHHEVDLVQHFVKDVGGASQIATPGYTSYALIRFSRHNQGMSLPFWVGHGSGGPGEVNRGSQKAQRRAVTYPDARFLVTGHIHKAWFQPHEQLRVNSSGKVTTNLQQHYSVGTFKDDYKKGKGGWGVEKGHTPTIPSVWWATFKFDSKKGIRFAFEHEILDG